MKTVLLALLVILSGALYCQDNSSYEPINNVDVDHALSHAGSIIKLSLKTEFYSFNYASKTLKSSWYTYFDGNDKRRCKFYFYLDSLNTFHVDVIDNKWIQREGSVLWKETTDSIPIENLKILRAELAHGIRKALQNDELCKLNREWFFTNLDINCLFYNQATSLATDRWFARYLNQQAVKWRLEFIDIQQSNNDEYKYVEYYRAYSVILDDHPLFSQQVTYEIQRFTNDDSKADLKLGEYYEVDGIIKSFNYSANTLNVVLIENLTH